MTQALLAVLLLAASLPAAAATQADLDGSWLGRMGCDTAAYRMTLRVDPRADGVRALSYALSELGGVSRRGGGTGVLRPDGALSLARPAGVPLLPETLPARMSFEKDRPRLAAWTELGALEPLAGGKAGCAEEDGARRLVCDIDWRLGTQGGVCRARLVKLGGKASPDRGPLPCPRGLAERRAGGRVLCAPAPAVPRGAR